MNNQPRDLYGHVTVSHLCLGLRWWRRRRPNRQHRTARPSRAGMRAWRTTLVSETIAFTRAVGMATPATLEKWHPFKQCIQLLQSLCSDDRIIWHTSMTKCLLSSHVFLCPVVIFGVPSLLRVYTFIYLFLF